MLCFFLIIHTCIIIFKELKSIFFLETTKKIIANIRFFQKYNDRIAIHNFRYILDISCHLYTIKTKLEQNSLYFFFFFLTIFPRKKINTFD